MDSFIAWVLAALVAVPGGAASGHDAWTAGADAEAIRLDSIAPRRERAPEGSQPEPPRRPRRENVPRVQLGNVKISDGIPVDMVRRIVRQNYGRYLACYKGGLRRNPKLQGKVEVHLDMEPDGSLSNLRDGGSALADAAVVRCMIDAVGMLRFPKPWARKTPETEKVNVAVQFLLWPS